MAAPASGCPLEAGDDLQRAVDALEEARTALWASSSSKGRPDDRRSRRRGDEARMSDTGSFAQLSSLQVQSNARFENENAVRISVPELKPFNLEGRAFYIGARFRSLEGQWSEWVTTQLWSVPNGNFLWKNAFNHFLRYSALAEEDFSGGRFHRPGRRVRPKRQSPA